MQSPRERLLYATALYVGTERRRPDYLATVDVDPDSKSYAQVVHRLPMPKIGDELHHFGWNMCSSCHGHEGKSRRYLIVPGLRSSLVTRTSVDPRYFRTQLRSVDGAAFGLEPTLTQSAWFRYHNRSEDIEGLYFVGASTHPGAGVPGVLNSARVLERVFPRPEAA